MEEPLLHTFAALFEMRSDLQQLACVSGYWIAFPRNGVRAEPLDSR